MTSGFIGNLVWVFVGFVVLVLFLFASRLDDGQLGLPQRLGFVFSLR